MHLAASSLWPPDWSQFLPDAILALATGLMVSLLLWWWQRNFERRAAREAAESGWQLAREHFVSSVRPLAENDDYYLVLVVADFDTLIAKGQLYPVGSWADAAPANSELAAVRRLLISTPILQRLAADISRTYTAQIVSAGDADASRTDLFERAASYVILEREMPFYLQGEPSRVATKHLVDDPALVRQVGEFRGLLARVEADVLLLHPGASHPKVNGS